MLAIITTTLGEVEFETTKQNLPSGGEVDLNLGAPGYKSKTNPAP